jgi:hypothetical protein
MAAKASGHFGQALVKSERLEHQLSDDLHFATIQPYFEESS